MTCYFDIDKCILKWLIKCWNKNITVRGIILFEEANEYAKQLGYTNSKVSNGHLANCKKRHNMIFLKVCGKSIQLNV